MVEKSFLRECFPSVLARCRGLSNRMHPVLKLEAKETR